jgi:hypothetical protein
VKDVARVTVPPSVFVTVTLYAPVACPTGMTTETVTFVAVIAVTVAVKVFAPWVNVTVGTGDVM